MKYYCVNDKGKDEVKRGERGVKEGGDIGGKPLGGREGK